MHPQFGSHSFSQFPTRREAECLEEFTEAIGHAGIGLHQGRKPFGKDLTRAIWRDTHKFAHR